MRQAWTHKKTAQAMYSQDGEASSNLAKERHSRVDSSVRGLQFIVEFSTEME